MEFYEMSGHENQIEESLRRLRNKMPNRYEGVTHRTPLDEMLAKELPDLDSLTERELRGEAQTRHIVLNRGTTTRDQILELIKNESEARWEQRMEGMQKVFDYLFADGPHPLNVIKRIIAMAKAVRPELICKMNGDDLAVLRDGLVPASARLDRLYSKRRSGSALTPAPGM